MVPSGVADGGDRVAAQVHDVHVLVIGFAGGRVGSALHQLVEELVLLAQVVLDAQLLDVGPVHEHDLGLDRHLRRPNIEPAHEFGEVGRPCCGCR